MILDEWAALTAHTDDIAARFVTLFEQHLMASEWQGLGPEESAAMGRTLERLHALGREVVVAAFDASLAREGRKRLRQLLPE